MPFFEYAIIALAIGCVDFASIAISNSMNLLSLKSPNNTMSLILKTPLVTVPVLSSYTFSNCTCLVHDQSVYFCQLVEISRPFEQYAIFGSCA